MTRAEKTEIYKIILRVGKILDHGKCRICKTQSRNGKGYAIDHLEYKKEEKTHKDFIEDKERDYLKDSERLLYMIYLEKIILETPKHLRRKRFCFLCNRDHYVQTQLRRFGDKKLNAHLRLRRIYVRNNTFI